VIVIIATVKRKIEAAGVRVAKQIWVLIALVGNAGNENFFFLEVNSITRGS